MSNPGIAPLILLQPGSEPKCEVGIPRVGWAQIHRLDKYLEEYSLSLGNIMQCGLIIQSMVLTGFWMIKLFWNSRGLLKCAALVEVKHLQYPFPAVSISLREICRLELRINLRRLRAGLLPPKSIGRCGARRGRALAKGNTEGETFYMFVKQSQEMSYLFHTF